MSFKKKHLKVLKKIFSLMLALCILIWSNIPVQAISEIRFSRNNPGTFEITNLKTGHPLNVYVENINQTYNGVPVTTFYQNVHDDTQRFNIVEYFGPYPNGNFADLCLITTTTGQYALNIGYRNAGSTTVMYDKNLDKEYWILDRDCKQGCRIILYSNMTLCLAENPYTGEVYLEPLDSSDYEVWHFENLTFPGIAPYVGQSENYYNFHRRYNWFH